MARHKKFKQQKKQTGQSQSVPVQRIYEFPASVSILSSFRQQSVFLFIIGALFYYNSIFNRYALDDDIVMRLNDYVQQGFAGIPTIMTTDAYDSFFKSMGSAGELQGGRYRPLSIVTFAIEQQLFGECHGTRMLEVRDSLANTPFMQANPVLGNKLIQEKAMLEAQITRSHESIAMVRHIVQVLLYIFSVIVLLKFLRQYLFRKNESVSLSVKWKVNPADWAFLVSVIFLIHPIHTEVVANVKRRDEIISFLFITLTLIMALRKEDEGKSKFLFLGMLYYFFALLSKEWGITLVALIPMMLYIFRNYSVGKSIKSSLPYAAVAVFYMILRGNFVGEGKTGPITEVLNNPYVYASSTEALATQIFILIKYIKLLFIPHPLSADYSYNTIPYKNFGDAGVWLSIAVHLALLYFLFRFLKKRNWMAFALAFYFAHLFLVSNLAMPIGATMGERLIYHSSFSFAMTAAFFLIALIQRFSAPSKTNRTEENDVVKSNAPKGIFSFLLLLLVVPAGYITVERNTNWKSDNILFMHDAWVAPNSVLANGNAGKAFIELAAETKEDTVKKKAMLDSAIYHLAKAVEIHPKYVNGYLNLGLAWFNLKELDKAEYYWGLGRKYFPSHPYFRHSYDPALANAFVEKGKQAGRSGKLPEAIQFLSRALHYDSTSAETWYHYGGANFEARNLNEAYRAWNKALQLNPGHQAAREGMRVLTGAMQKQQE